MTILENQNQNDPKAIAKHSQRVSAVLAALELPSTTLLGILVSIITLMWIAAEQPIEDLLDYISETHNVLSKDDLVSKLIEMGEVNRAAESPL